MRINDLIVFERKLHFLGNTTERMNNVIRRVNFVDQIDNNFALSPFNT